MPLDAAQVTWLSQATKIKLPLPGGKPVGDGGEPTQDELAAMLREKHEEEAMRDEQRKQLALADAARTVKPLKPVLRSAFDLQVTNASGTTQQFQTKTGDVGELAESHEIGGTQSISRGGSATKKLSQKEEMALLREARQAYSVVVTLRDQLDGMTTTRSRIKPTGEFFDGPPEPLFTNAEITDEVFTPLVREKILPDTFITGNYSAVQKMLDGSTALYKEELKESGSDASTMPELLKKAVDYGSKVTGAVLSVTGVDPKLAATLLEGSTALAKMSIDFLGKIPGGLDAKSVTDLLDGLPDVVGSMVGAALGDKELGELIGAAGSAGTAGINMVVASVKEGRPAPGELVNLVSTLITVGLMQVKPSSDKEKAGITFGDDIQKALAKATSSRATTFFDNLLAGDTAKARSDLLGVVKDVVLSLPSLASDTKDLATSSDTELTPKDKQEAPTKGDKGLETGVKSFETVAKTVESAQEKREKMLKRLSQMDDVGAKKLKELGDKVDEAASNRAKAETDPEGFAKDVADELKKEEEAFKKELAGLGDIGASDKTIEKLMAKIQRDRAIMSVAVAIGSGGISVASKFFAPLAVGTEIIKMSMNIAAAVQRAVDLRKFLETQRKARNAVSPYITSVQNFVDNQANQLTEYSIRVALNGVNIAASVAATAFPLAAPAIPVAAMIQSGTELIFAEFDELRLRTAWNVTKLAMDNPSNRKMGLRARKLNPTLAKYTIAYGAEIARDPVALQMCQDCGLSMDTVANANAKKIKAYLELRFDQDGVVLKTYVDPSDWMSDVPEPDAFTPATVFGTYAVFKDAVDRNLLTGQISGTLKPPADLTTMVRLAGTDLPDTATPEEMEERLMVLGRIVGGFKAEAARLAPLGDGVETTVAAFAGIADVRQQRLVMRLLKAKQSPP